MRIFLFLLMCGFVSTGPIGNERTYIELKEIRKVDTISNISRSDDDSFLNGKEIIRTYHHIIKKILPVYPDDTTTEIPENFSAYPDDRSSGIENKLPTHANTTTEIIQRLPAYFDDTNAEIRKRFPAYSDKTSTEKSRKLPGHRDVTTTEIIKKLQAYPEDSTASTNRKISVYPHGTTTEVKIGVREYFHDTSPETSRKTPTYPDYMSTETNKRQSQNSVKTTRKYSKQGLSTRIKHGSSKKLRILRKSKASLRTRTPKFLHSENVENKQMKFRKFRKYLNYNKVTSNKQRFTKHRNKNGRYHVNKQYMKQNVERKLWRRNLMRSFIRAKRTIHSLNSEGSNYFFSNTKAHIAPTGKRDKAIVYQTESNSSELTSRIVIRRRNTEAKCQEVATATGTVVLCLFLPFTVNDTENDTASKNNKVDSNADNFYLITLSPRFRGFKQKENAKTNNTGSPGSEKSLDEEESVQTKLAASGSTETPTAIDLEDVIKLMDNEFPSKEIVEQDHEFAIEVALENSSAIAINVSCENTAPLKTKLKVYSIFLWFMGMFCLLVIVAMAFLVHVMQMKYSLLEPVLPKLHKAYFKMKKHKNLDGFSEAKPQGYSMLGKDTPTADRAGKGHRLLGKDMPTDDMQVLIRAVQKALNSHFYEEAELLLLCCNENHTKMLMKYANHRI